MEGQEGQAASFTGNAGEPQPEPKPYQRRPGPTLVDPFKPIIDAILQADQDAPRKQRHTAAKIFRRLRDEHGYPGDYEGVRLYVLAQGRTTAETFIPLDHDPGQRLEADFGHIHVDLPAGRQLVPVLLTTWAYSNCPFALAPTVHSRWRCPRSVRRQSCTVWSRRSRSMAVCRGSCGGITREPSRRNCSPTQR